MSAFCVSRAQGRCTAVVSRQSKERLSVPEWKWAAHCRVLLPRRDGKGKAGKKEEKKRQREMKLLGSHQTVSESQTILRMIHKCVLPLSFFLSFFLSSNDSKVRPPSFFLSFSLSPLSLSISHHLLVSVSPPINSSTKYFPASHYTDNYGTSLSVRVATGMLE